MTTATKTLTASQVAALRKLSPDGLPERPNPRDYPVNRGVAYRLMDAGLIEWTRRTETARARLVLTAAGRAALEGE